MNFPASLTSMPVVGRVTNEIYSLGDTSFLESNAWAAKNALMDDATITTYRDGERFGWTAVANDERPNFVQAYPEVKFGRKPWDGVLPNWNPPQICRLSHLSLDLAFTWDADGDANAAIDMWLLRRPDGGPESIAAEVMIWLDKKGGIQPAGSPVGGDLWMRDGFADGEWPYFAFCPARSEQIDLKKYLDFLAHRGSITDDLYVSSIEFGTELISGSLWCQVDRAGLYLSAP